MGKYLLESLRQIHHPEIKEARGVGLFVALELRQPGAAVKFSKEIIKHGVATKELQNNVI